MRKKGNCAEDLACGESAGRQEALFLRRGLSSLAHEEEKAQVLPSA